MDTGAPIPDLTLPTGDGGDIALAGSAPCVIYFYPRDDTPGCTSEAKDFTALASEFESLGVKLIGISKDSAAKHAKFSAKHGLTVTLASDTDGAACEAFGTWVEKSLYGRKYMGIERATFLFGANGRLAREWRKVRVKGHAKEVLDVAKALDTANG